MFSSINFVIAYIEHKRTTKTDMTYIATLSLSITIYIHQRGFNFKIFHVITIFISNDSVNKLNSHKGYIKYSRTSMPRTLMVLTTAVSNSFLSPLEKIP